MMSESTLRERLKDRIERMPIIDAHEHLRPEAAHLQTSYNFFHLFIPYIMYDLYSAGMPEKWIEHGPSNEAEVEECWRDVEPVWRYVKHGSYARSMLRAPKEFWGIDDITGRNYREIGDLLNATRQPGHYRKVLVEKCGIRWVLNQVRAYSHDEPFMKGAFVVEHHLKPGAIRAFVEERGEKATLDDYCALVAAEMRKASESGAAQVKFDVSHGFCCLLNEHMALEDFGEVKRDPKFTRMGCLNAYVSDRLLSYLPELGMPAAVHTGVWDDIRAQSPEHLYSVVARHPDVTFDVYHIGIPHVHECGFLGKNYPNVYLNLCWSHIVAPEMVVRALGEMLDYVPTNKVFGFGGDFLYNPEQTWGALQVAKDNLAEVFARKVHKGVMDIDGAEEILRLWLYENPARVYGL